MLVSHDVALLTKGTNSIAEVSGKTLVQYVSCTYEKYLQEKEFRAKSAIAEYERNLKEAERLQVLSSSVACTSTTFWTKPPFCRTLWTSLAPVLRKPRKPRAG